MEPFPDDLLTEEIAAHRGQITIFDVWKNNRRRNRVMTSRLVAKRGRSWNIAANISIGMGLWAAWADIVGGASFDRVFIVWMVAAGVAFMVISRLEKTILWSAAVSILMAAAIVAAQFKIWLESDDWLDWIMFDVAHFSGFEPNLPGPVLLWVLERTASGVFLGLGLIFLITGLSLRRLTRDHPS
jgi:hypothetical protein